MNAGRAQKAKQQAIAHLVTESELSAARILHATEGKTGSIGENLDTTALMDCLKTQVAAACQMNGLNDPSASRKQRIAAMTCYEMLMEAIMTGIESGLDKEQVKQMMNDAVNRAAEFFCLGNKQAVKARAKARRKAA